MAGNDVDNWESLGEDELEKRLKALDEHFPLPSAAAKLQNDGIQRRSGSAPQLYEDVPRSMPQPQLRILKRQTTDSSAALSDQSGTASVKPVRTLKEREMAYAEARQRIFGNRQQEDRSDPSLVTPVNGQCLNNCSPSFKNPSPVNGQPLPINNCSSSSKSNGPKAYTIRSKDR